MKQVWLPQLTLIEGVEVETVNVKLTLSMETDYECIPWIIHFAATSQRFASSSIFVNIPFHNLLWNRQLIIHNCIIGTVITITLPAIVFGT